MKTAEMKVLPVSILKPAEYNPRKKLKPGDKEYEKIKNSIEEFGFADPLVVNADMTIIGGHQRLTVAVDAVFYSDTQPAATGRKVYDIWFDTANDNTMYFWSGSSWTQKQFGTGAIGEQAITADLLAANCVTTDKIVSRAITAAKIATGTITANEIAANTITADRIAGNTITANEIAANTITANEIAANTITANEIAGNTITADKLSVETLSAITADLGSITAGSLDIGNGKFMVTSAGALTATGADITGKITASYGQIGSWIIPDGANTGTSAAGGHCYGSNSLYGHSASATYEYETGMKVESDPGTIAFYVKRMAKDAAWSTAEYTFYVRHDGYLYATAGKIAGWNIAATSLNNTNASGNYVSLGNGTNSSGDVLVVRTGAGTSASPYVYPFYLRADGTLYSTKATITGAVTATSGKIAGFTIDGNSLKNGNYIDLSAYNATYGGARLQLGPGNGAHATLSSSELVIYNASGADSYIHPTAIFTGGSITASSASIGTGGLTVASTITATSTGPNVWARNSTTSCGVSIHSSSAGNHGVYSSGYYNGSKYTENGKWMLYRSTSNTICVPWELYTHNQGYTTLRPVIGTNAGTNAIGVIVSNSASVGFYGRWAGGASASMSGRTVSCPSSDIRLKKNIKDSETDALSVINAIRIRQFDWKDPSRGHWDCGMVVDEMERDIDAKFCIGGEDDGDGTVSYKSVDTFYLQGYEVKAIQELSQKIRMLEEEIKRLKAA